MSSLNNLPNVYFSHKQTALRTLVHAFPVGVTGKHPTPSSMKSTAFRNTPFRAYVSRSSYGLT